MDKWESLKKMLQTQVAAQEEAAAIAAQEESIAMREALQHAATSLAVDPRHILALMAALEETEREEREERDVPLQGRGAIGVRRGHDPR